MGKTVYKMIGSKWAIIT